MRGGGGGEEAVGSRVGDCPEGAPLPFRPARERGGREEEEEEDMAEDRGAGAKEGREGRWRCGGWKGW